MSASVGLPTVSQRVRSGDLWQLGRHRLLCGDSTDANAVMRLMQGERARLTITSPPYNLGRNARLAHTPAPSKYRDHPDQLPPAVWRALLRSSTYNALVVSDIAIVNVQMLAGNKVTLLEWLYRFREQVIDVVIWDKGCGAPAQARNVLTSRFEFLWFLTNHRSKGRTPRTLFTADFRGTLSNMYAAPPRRGNAYFRLHAATFPLHLPTWLMTTFDSEAGSVFDPFLGTGTTLIAAERLGRACFGMEIEPDYCDIVLQRWEQETGLTAQRIHSPPG